MSVGLGLQRTNLAGWNISCITPKSTQFIIDFGLDCLRALTLLLPLFLDLLTFFLDLDLLLLFALFFAL